LPLLAGIVKCPFWSVCIWPEIGIHAGYTCFERGSCFALVAVRVSVACTYFDFVCCAGLGCNAGEGGSVAVGNDTILGGGGVGRDSSSSSSMIFGSWRDGEYVRVSKLLRE